VFERYPDLRVILLEGGVAWVPGLLWRFDADFKGARRELPWLHRLPSQYFRDNVRLTTQPLEIPAGNEHLYELLDEAYATETLMFASDYPYDNGNDPLEVADSIPAGWRESVLRGTALATFRWPAMTN
jgi:predicted TIM-barrel fold metal-dependent hydrolase